MKIKPSNMTKSTPRHPYQFCEPKISYPQVNSKSESSRVMLRFSFLWFISTFL
jgi:hypothetical protein